MRRLIVLVALVMLAAIVTAPVGAGERSMQRLTPERLLEGPAGGPPSPSPVRAGATGAVECQGGGQLPTDECRVHHWVSRTSTPAGLFDASEIAVSPDGSVAFVVGDALTREPDDDFPYDWGTVAIRVSDGARLWTAYLDGKGLQWDIDTAEDVAVSPDGRTVFVAGSLFEGSATRFDAGVAAYDAANGDLRWHATYDGGVDTGFGPGDDAAQALGLSPDGTVAYVSIWSHGPPGESVDFVTLALDTANGATLWESRWSGEFGDASGSPDEPVALAVSPAGDLVFVGGRSYGRDSLGLGDLPYDVTTIALEAATGEVRWVDRINGPSDGWDYAEELVVDAAGERVFTLGKISGSSVDWVVAGYDAASGERAWTDTYDAGGPDWPEDLTIAPDGSRVYAAGVTLTSTGGWDMGLVAYEAASGERAWARAYDARGGATDWGYGVAATDDAVFLTGESYGETRCESVLGNCFGYLMDYATVAFDAATGAERWVGRYNDGGFGYRTPYYPSLQRSFTSGVHESSGGITVAPDGGSMLVFGEDDDDAGNMDLSVVAYDAS